jgi:hypothetical protein
MYKESKLSYSQFYLVLQAQNGTQCKTYNPCDEVKISYTLHDHFTNFGISLERIKNCTVQNVA